MATVCQSPTTDFTSTTLNGSITDTATTIAVNDASTIVTPCYAVIDREDNNGVATPNQREVVYVSAKSTNNLTVTRGVDNSTKRAHNDSAKFEPLITVGFWDDFYDAYDNEHDPADGSHDITKIVVLSGATIQTLAGKILSSPTISSPTFSGTLSNLILSSPTVTTGSIGTNLVFPSVASTTAPIHTILNQDGNIVINPGTNKMFLPITSCRARVSLSGNQTIATDADAKILLDTEEYDPGSNFASYKFTIPITGQYTIESAIQFAANNTGVRGLNIYKNGAMTMIEEQQAVQSDAHRMSTCRKGIPLNKNDYIEMYAFQKSGGPLAVNAGANLTYLTVILEGISA